MQVVELSAAGVSSEDTRTGLEALHYFGYSDHFSLDAVRQHRNMDTTCMQPWTQCSLHDQTMIGQLNVIDYSQLAFEGWLMTWDSYGVHRRKIGWSIIHRCCRSIDLIYSVNSCIV